MGKKRKILPSPCMASQCILQILSGSFASCSLLLFFLPTLVHWVELMNFLWVSIFIWSRSLQQDHFCLFVVF